MGLIGRIFGGAGATAALGTAVEGVAKVFTPSATRRMELDAQAYLAAVGEASAEVSRPRQGGFDRAVDGLNRLPRPMLALGTLGLFVYAMADPAGFGLRMAGLSRVPEPLWWLLGAIVSFYFGAREAFHIRNPRGASAAGAALGTGTGTGTGAGAAAAVRPPAEDDNAALRDWTAQGRIGR